MGEQYNQLLQHLTTLEQFDRINIILRWDQQVNMPPKGAKARAAQRAMVVRLRNELITSDMMRRAIEVAEQEMQRAPADSDEASMIRLARHEYEEATRLPADMTAQIEETTALGNQAWVSARAAGDFSIFLPAFKRILDLTRRKADYLGYAEHPYDALVGESDPDLTAANVQLLFNAHKPGLIALLNEIRQRPEPDNSFIHQPFDVAKQREFTIEVIKAMGYDFERGRFDSYVHPLEVTFGRGDVRVATRFEPEYLIIGPFGAIHEVGHALYEQGIPERLDGTPLGHGTTWLIHESQARLWENNVGFSRELWTWAYPRLQSYFPEQLGKVEFESFYRGITRVKPTTIRVDADEVTYNLHIMLRTELEMELVRGALQPEDVPKAWNERFEAYLGIEPPAVSLGPLQDIHWSIGLIGYFPMYALGNLASAQQWYKVLDDHPTLPAEMAQGKFDTLLGWLNTNIHAHGRKFQTDALLKKATGRGLEADSFMRYLRERYGGLYGIE